jgi:hypothetical protein
MLTGCLAEVEIGKAVLNGGDKPMEGGDASPQGED